MRRDGGAGGAARLLHHTGEEAGGTPSRGEEAGNPPFLQTIQGGRGHPRRHACSRLYRRAALRPTRCALAV